MKKIGWIKLASRRYGGVVYGEQAREALAKNFDVELMDINSKRFKRGYLRAPELFFNLLKLKGEKDLWIREDIYPVIAFPWNKTKGKNLVMIYHIDFSQSKGLAKIIDFFLEKLIYLNIKRVGGIVTMSEYWKNHFLEKGCKNVYRVYHNLDFKNFNITEEEIQKFKKKFNLEEKPIIYIGNCQIAKGAPDSYEALKDLDVYLVTSGEPFVKIPALNLNLAHRDYLTLLKASSAVVTMSKFKEGWCITAHEAMLLKTPVIGSGLGGMRELLEGGKQIICEDFASLKEKVEYLLNNPKEREKMGEQGHNFAKNFNLERFKKEWLKLIKGVVSQKNINN